MRKGLLSWQSVALPTIYLSMLYVYYFNAGSEKPFVLIWIYKINSIMLIVALCTYSIDGFLYIFYNHMFCTMQALKPALKCDERNKYFLVQVAAFFLFWAPLWHACNLSIYRYARTNNETSRFRRTFHRMERPHKLNDVRNLLPV